MAIDATKIIFGQPPNVLATIQGGPFSSQDEADFRCAVHERFPSDLYWLTPQHCKPYVLQFFVMAIPRGLR